MTTRKSKATAIADAKSEMQKQIPPLHCGMTNKKGAKAATTATAKANTGVLRCAQNDNFC
jgi:hypothetical protein